MIYKLFASFYIFSVILLSHYGWGTKYGKIVAASFFGLVIIERLWNKKNLLEISPQHIIFLLWSALAFFAGLISSSYVDAFNSMKRVLLVFSASIPLYMVLVDHLCLRWVSWTLVIAAIASNAIIVFGILPPPKGIAFGYVGSRFAGTQGNANLFAFVCLIGLTSITYLWKVHHRGLVKVLIFSAGVLIAYQIIISGSRKGAFGVFLILFLQYAFFVLDSKKERYFKRSVGGLVALSFFLCLFGYLIMTGDYGYRVRNIMHYVKGERLEKGEQSISSRSYFFSIGLNNFLENPFIGTGFSSFDDIDVGPDFWSTRIGRYAHSNFVEVMVSSGVLGLILYYSIYLTCILRVSHQFKSEIDDSLKPLLHFATTAITLLIFYELFAVTYYGKEFWIFLSCILASVTILSRQPVKLVE